jgi:RHS repeat-associated protein
MGTQRILSKLSDAGTMADPTKATMATYTGSTLKYATKYTTLTKTVKARYDSLGVAYNGVDNKGATFFKASPGGGLEGLYYYHSDQLGSANYITDANGDVAQHLEYIPYGETFVDERYNNWHTPYVFNGKERDEETGLTYYGARYLDKNGVWLSVDPLAHKYPNVSSYVYCMANPVKYVDPDGRVIVPVLFMHTNNRGHALGQQFTSSNKYLRAMEDFTKTKFGRDFIASFLKIGEKQYGVNGNGKYADCELRIYEYNMDKPNEQGVFMKDDGKFSVSEIDGKLVFELFLDVKNLNSSSILETIVHELGLHGANYEEIIQAYKKGGIKAVNLIMQQKGANGDSDHKDLINENKSNRGVSNYYEIFDELIHNNQNFKKLFDKVKDEDRNKYKNLQ